MTSTNTNAGADVTETAAASGNETRGARRSGVVLVTGASSGIGEATARLLADQGYTVYGAARREDRLSRMAGDGVRPVQLDVTDDASMQAAVAKVLEEEHRIDVLINNAGYGSYGPVEQVDIAEARRQFDVNVFGMARMSQLVIPAMRAQGEGRIINISSMADQFYEPLAGWYHASKYAVDGLSSSMRVELAPFGIRVIVVRPGLTKSEWSDASMESLRRTSEGTPYQEVASQMARLYERGMELASDPRAVAERIVQAVNAENPNPHYAAGRGTGAIIGAVNAVPDKSLDKIIAGFFGGKAGDAALSLDERISAFVADERVKEAQRTARDLLGKGRDLAEAAVRRLTSQR